MFYVRILWGSSIIMLSLSAEHKTHLSVLFDQPPQLLQDFCRLALNLLTKGHNPKLYSTAAQKLQVEVHVIQLAIEALLQFIALTRQHSLCRSSFRDLALASGFSDDQEVILSSFYESTRELVDSTLSCLAPTSTHYHDLEWRFDVQVASRSLIRQTIPILSIKLTVVEKPQQGTEATFKSLLLQTDPNNLKHLIQKLDEALSEASSQHSRKMLRLLK